MATTMSKSIMHDPDYYTKAFHAYSDRLGNFRVRCSWVDSEFPALVDKLAKSFSPDTTIRMLGIGSGSGEMDSKMAIKIKSSFKAVHNTVVEPAAKQLDMYRQLVESRRDEFSGIEYDFRQDTMDGYRAKLKEAGVEQPKYHFISAVHSLYYVDDLAESIGYLYDRLEDGGLMLLTCVAEDGGFWRLWNRFSRFQDDVSRFLCTSHFREAHESHSIAFEISPQSSRVNITDCFDPNSEEGRLVVDFLAHTVDLRGTAPPEVQQEVLDFLGSDQCSEKLENGTVLFMNDWEAFISQKPVSSAS